MKRIVALMMCAVSLGASAQITYPYNPDGNADSLISVPDIQDFLSVYGNSFAPNEIMIGDSTVVMDTESFGDCKPAGGYDIEPVGIA